MARVYISIGSNIEPLRHIRAGLADLQRQFGDLIVSSVYESLAVGFEGNNFYNLVAGFDTLLEVHSTIQLLRDIEQNNGRQRHGERFSARTLDLDLLLYDDLILKEANLELPRDEITKYAFVLLPLAEIAPDSKHPVTGQRYITMAKQFDLEDQTFWRVSVNVLP